MNILPKKRWHVRTKDNIARVRKDEAAAHEEERKRNEKFELAESEARIKYLRNCSGLPEKQQHEKLLNEEVNNSQHVNLFADYKTHIKTTNKELEKEQKEEQEKYEKKIGYLTYLGQDTNEALRLKSWYEVAPNRSVLGSEREDINEKDLKTKRNNDPLTLIYALLPRDHKLVSNSTSSNRKRSPSTQLSVDEVGISKSSKKREKAHKKRMKAKHKSRSKEQKQKKLKIKEKAICDEQKLKIVLLRKERLRRENREKARQDALLAQKESRTTTDATSSFTPKVVQKYNSQFNPELAKQNLN